ncbi:MAG: alpha amylase C-terminal domain-containing protein, partial [Rhodanobacteraceae bacterium]
VQALVRHLNRAYRELPALHQRDCDATGFQWVEMNDEEQSTLAFLRYDGEHRRPVLVACNFTPVPRTGYRVGVPLPGFWRERINTDAAVYGGSNMGNAGGVQAENTPSHGQPCALRLTLPPLATLILEVA